MPLYMDSHERVRGITLEAVTRAYKRCLEVQGRHGVRFLRLWVHQDPEDHGRLFCLAEAPSREALTLAHIDAHGLWPNEIHEVVEASLEVAPHSTTAERTLVHA
jgi:uncharacterized protein DUF4242